MHTQLTTHPPNANGARFQRSLDFRFRFIETNAEQIYTFFLSLRVSNSLL